MKFLKYTGNKENPFQALLQKSGLKTNRNLIFRIGKMNEITLLDFGNYSKVHDILLVENEDLWVRRRNLRVSKRKRSLSKMHHMETKNRRDTSLQQKLVTTHP